MAKTVTFKIVLPVEDADALQECQQLLGRGRPDDPPRAAAQRWLQILIEGEVKTSCETIARLSAPQAKEG